MIAIEGNLQDSLMQKRRIVFKQELLGYTYMHYRKEKRELEEVNPEVAATIEDDEDLTEWPDFFEVDEHVPAIPKASLKSPPKLRGAQTMNDLLNSYDVRAQLQQRMSEAPT